MRQHLALALLAIITLSACGNKGSLTFPPPPAAPAATGGTSEPVRDPAAPANASAASNSSTPGVPAR